MQVATWNLNSIRAREARLLAWLGRAQPDLVCLPELKTEAAGFPTAALEAAGYRAAVWGQKTYNGVAILSREGTEDVRCGFGDGGDETQARVISARVRGLNVLSVYVPNGGEVGSDKWRYKLEWLDRLAACVRARFRPDEPLLIGGDFNVAPDDADVAEPELFADSVLCHRDARARLETVLAWGLRDVFREQHPAGGVYSWWDYRRLAFPRNAGLRIDLVLATGAVRCTHAAVDRDERKGERPSDHAPVIVTVDP